MDQLLRSTESKVLLVFNRKAYPTVDPGPETELVARLHEAVTGDGEVDPVVIDAVVATLDEEVDRAIEDLRRLRGRRF